MFILCQLILYYLLSHRNKTKSPFCYQFHWKNKKASASAEALIFIKRLDYAFGSTDTKDLLFAFFLKTTLPSTNANKVWSLPIPTLSPGWC